MKMQIKTDGIIRSSLLSQQGVIHGFSTKQIGNMSFDRSQKGRANNNQQIFFQKLGIDLNQTAVFFPPVRHSTNVALVSKSDKNNGRIILNDQSQEIIILDREKAQPGIDSCISFNYNTFLAILPADCAPVMLFEPLTKFFGLIHVGSLGLKNNIIEKTFDCLKKHCEIPARHFYCYIGPCICKNCYTHQVDLRNLIAGRLFDIGVSGSKMEVSQLCTAHDEQLFFSHHRAQKSGKDQAEGRNMAIIGLKKQ
ncbi:MAG: hypothetical protein GF365_00175 [Candidatus Buchananbacteria bacterium]|nr:hypothetical protein [Candidatus Buchananbacteria bacterium]